MTPEQTKAFEAGLEQMKTAAAGMTAATEQMKTVAANTEAQGKAINAIEERMKAQEPTLEAFKAFAEAFGEDPVQGKTVHVIAASPEAAAKAAEAEKSAAALPKDGDDLTNNKGARLEAFKSIYKS